MHTFGLFETHLHTREMSDCGKVPASEMIRRYAQAGYMGALVTDHFIPGRFQNARAREAFLAGYRLAADEGAKTGLTVLPSMEICFASGIEDFLVLGLTEQEILREVPDNACEMEPQAFYGLCQKHGWLFYQAHPFRPQMRAMPASWVDGIEIFNGNVRHDAHNETARQYALNNDLMTLAGSDAHHPEDVAQAGIYLPTASLSAKGLVRYLREVRRPGVYNAAASETRKSHTPSLVKTAELSEVI